MDNGTVNLKQIRLLIIIGTTLLGGFMFADLALLPSSLHDVYLTSRVILQFPVCVLFLLSTFLPNFQKLYQPILFTVILTIIFINYWLILVCWQLEQFAFSYEGTVMYSLFALFVFRLNFKYGLYFAAIILLGFTLLIFNYPIYGDKNSVSLGFVFVGLVVGLLGVFQLEKAWEQVFEKNLQLIYLNQTDHLTNILNRGTYEVRFQEKLSLNKRYGNAVCVYFIDLDNFKDYNDGYGHVQGDEIIKLQAKMLRNIFQRSTDIVARYGGEEFVVVTSNVNEKLSQKFAQQIIDQWTERKVTHNKGKAGPFVSCSVGYYFEEAGIDSKRSEMVKKADDALYQAKASGRNCAVQYKNKNDNINTFESLSS